MTWLVLLEVTLLIVASAPKTDAIICFQPMLELSDEVKGPFPSELGYTVSPLNLLTTYVCAKDGKDSFKLSTFRICEKIVVLIVAT